MPSQDEPIGGEVIARGARRRFTARALAKRLDDFGDRCACCRRPTGGANGLQWDHIIPLALGGEDALANLQPLCRGCHKAKTAEDAGKIGKAKRQRQRTRGIPRVPKRLIPGSKGSGWRRGVWGDARRVVE